MKALSLEDLKALVQVRTPRESLPFSMLPGGIPKGAITEISGPGKTEAVLRFLGEHEGLKVAWVEDQFSVFPLGFIQNRIALKRVLFMEAGAQIHWVALQALKAQIFPVVVVYTDQSDVKSLRRLQLAAEKSQATTILLSPTAGSYWPVSLQLQVQRSGEDIEIQILKRRTV
jgi:hypothetical protein